MPDTAKPALVVDGNATPAGPSMTAARGRQSLPPGGSVSDVGGDDPTEEPTMERTPLPLVARGRAPSPPMTERTPPPPPMTEATPPPPMTEATRPPPPSAGLVTARTWPPLPPGSTGPDARISSSSSPAIVSRTARERRLPVRKKVIAVVKAASTPARGLIRAVLADKESQFAIRAITPNLDSNEGRVLRALGIEVVAGDVGDEVSLKRAFGGAYGAFYVLLSSEHPSLETKLAEANSLALAAKEAGLQHVVWATLEDPGQTLLQHDDLTPTFKDGRWVPDSDGKSETDGVFAKVGVPTTFLQTSWDPSVAAGAWAEDIGKYAYGILGNSESVSKTFSISAGSLAAGLMKAGPASVEADGSAVVVTASPPADAAPESAGPPILRPALVAAAPLGATRVAPVDLSLHQNQPSMKAPRRTARTIAIALALVGVAAGGLLLTGRFRGLPSEVVPAASPGPDPVGAPPAVPVVAEAPRKPEPAAPAAIDKKSGDSLADRNVAENAAEKALGEPPAPNPLMAAGTKADTAPKRSVQTGRHRKDEPSLRELEAPAGPSAAPSPPSAVLESPTPREAPPHVPASESPRKTEVVPPPAEPVAPASPPVVARVADPPRQVALPAGYVEPKAVTAAVKAHASEARTCFERAVMEHPDLHGRVTVTATLDPSGRIVSASTASSIEGGARLESCLLAAFKNWTFPAPSGGVNGNITYSFSFKGATP
jgi:TonB family protein